MAILGGSDAIVTENLRGFPEQTLARFSIVATRPAEHLWADLDLDIRIDTIGARQR